MKLPQMSAEFVFLFCPLKETSSSVSSTFVLMLFSKWSFLICQLNIHSYFVSWMKHPHISAKLVSSFFLLNEVSSYVKPYCVLMLSTTWSFLVCQLNLHSYFVCWMKLLHTSPELVSFFCLLKEASSYVNATCVPMLSAEWSFLTCELNLHFFWWLKLFHMSAELMSLLCLLNEASSVRLTCQLDLLSFFFFWMKLPHMSAKLVF